MALYALSDLHLDEAAEARLFRDDRQGTKLAGLCERMARDPRAEVVLLGDIFDFTAMNPPERGLPRFFEALGMPERTRPRRDVSRLCAAVRESNPRAIAALATLSQRVPVTLVPGNHDHHLAGRDAAGALAAIGLGSVQVQEMVVREIGGRRVVLRHGHELDEANAKPGGPGEVLTNCMHHAVVPFLRHHGGRRNVRIDPDRVVALRPEESVIPVLERWLEPRTFRRFFRALLRLLGDNGALPRLAAWLAPLISAEHVRKHIEEQDALWQRAGRTALRGLARRGPLGGPQPDVLVLGHTHTLDWAVADGAGPSERLYVNLGTWTDRCVDAHGAPDTTLPMLEVSEQDGHCQARLVDLDDDGGELQRFEAPV